MITNRTRTFGAAARPPAQCLPSEADRPGGATPGEARDLAVGTAALLSADGPMTRAARRLRQAEAGWLAEALRHEGGA
ncbi:hypothetical protein VQ042_06760 [Aurantimonas sp. A2-1-M11]|uniref:hypothetical protein n=1 Tax=Aurantimonas sp. A2-1-M11 TaxID=3113712 RepID=UPI002F9540E1